MKIHRVRLSRAHLDQIPAPERRLLVLVAHATNEIRALSKLFHFAAGQSSAGEIYSQAESAQAMVLARSLTGSIYEFWQLLGSSFFGSALSKEYEPRLDPEERESLAALKRYFNKNNLIALVRNKFAYHYSPDQIDAGYGVMTDEDPLFVYLAQDNANTLYAFAETIVSRSMLEAIHPGDHAEAFSALIREASDAVRNINVVGGALMAICISRYVGANLYELGADTVEVEGAPDSQSVRIPYFIEVDVAA